MTPDQRREQRQANLAAWKSLRKTLPAKRQNPKKSDPSTTPKGTRTRFSRENIGTCARHSRDLIRLEVVRLKKSGKNRNRIAKILGIPQTTVQNWLEQTTLPIKPTSPYTFAKMLACVTLAKHLYRQKFDADPKRCLWEAIRRTPTMKRSSVKVYLSLEAVPTLPGFPLYADQAVQARCEALGRGERKRGTDIFDETPVFSPPSQPAPAAQAPNAPVSMPLVRMPVFDRAKFLSCRMRLGLPRLRC